MLMKNPVLYPDNAFGLLAFMNAQSHHRGFKVAPHMYAPAMAIMDERIPKVLIIIGPGATKSSMVSIGFPAFKVGQDPTNTFIGISAGESLMQGFQAGVGEIIEQSDIWRHAFPKVRPDYDRGWSTDKGLFVTGRDIGDDNANYSSFGLTSTKLTGVHGKFVVCDDLHNKENTQSSTQVQSVIDSWYKTILGRSDPRGCRYIVTGRRWRGDDIYAHLASTGEFVTLTLPAERTNSKQLYWDVTVPDGLVCCFNESEE